MKVLKFGGTSVGTPASIQNVKNIISTQTGPKIVVLSAMSGVTNELAQIIQEYKEGKRVSVSDRCQGLLHKHIALVEELFPASENREEVIAQLEQLFEELEQILAGNFQAELEPVILTYGELFLTFIFSKYLHSERIPNTWLDAKEFMHISNLENPELKPVRSLLKETLKREIRSQVYVTQGFVCIDGFRNINTLKRGGSDYSATIIAAAVGAEEVQIWTDIDGFHNNDPRYVEGTEPLSHLTFDEAAELAYFGAKILHPQTVSPVKERNIPIYLKDTFHPEASGTLISSEVKTKGLKAISAKDGITAIKIKSNRMLMAHGFLRKIFEVFDNHKTAIDMITTSEIAISLTIDDATHLEDILTDLESFGEITVDQNHSIICVVGEAVIDDPQTYKLFEILNSIPVRMISYGGSSNNISLLVDTRNKIEILRQLNSKLFAEKLVAH